MVQRLQIVWIYGLKRGKPAKYRELSISCFRQTMVQKNREKEIAGKANEFESPEAEGLFYLQSGVYKTPAGARSYTEELALLGLEPLVISGDVYKVVLGPYADDIEAQIAGETIIFLGDLNTQFSKKNVPFILVPIIFLKRAVRNLNMSHPALRILT